MREITVSTCLYRKQLCEFSFKTFAACAREESGCRFLIGTESEARFFRALAGLIQNLTLAENPVVKNSEPLRVSVRRLVFGKNTVLKELRRFFSENDRIYLDGYLQFAMRGYSEKINTLLYLAVKKNFQKLYDLN